MSPRDLFAWPEALPILVLVPLAWLLLRFLDHSRSKRLERELGPRAPRLAAELSEGRRRMKRRLILTGFLLILISMLQPMWGEGLRKIKQRGIDILVCLDVSRSMLARDLTPSRLKRAQHEIRTLAERVQGDRLGLVVFAGEARLNVPLTQDMHSFADLVDLACPLSVRRGGTDLGAALETAIEALDGQNEDDKAVLLLTDGEDLEQRGLSVAEKCRDRKITVHCVGFGSARGSKITVEEEGGEVFLRDRSGNEIVSAMDSSSLRRIAETTGGDFVDAGARPMPLLKLYEKRILGKAGKSLDVRGSRERKNRFQWPLLAAFMLLVLKLCMTDRKV